jgi:hypothetical protein
VELERVLMLRLRKVELILLGDCQLVSHWRFCRFNEPWIFATPQDGKGPRVAGPAGMNHEALTGRILLGGAAGAPVCESGETARLQG